MGLVNGIKAFGFVPVLVTVVIGAPSILVILEIIFKGYQLTDSLQWLVDSWLRMQFVVGQLLHPITQPIVDFIRSFGIDVELHNHWVSVFCLLMSPAIGIARALQLENDILAKEQNLPDIGFLYKYTPVTLVLVFCTIVIFFVSFAAGLVSPQYGWISQSLILMALILAFGMLNAIFVFMSGDFDKALPWRSKLKIRIHNTAHYLLKILRTSLFFSALVAISGLIPYVDQSALLVIVACILVYGVYVFIHSRRKETKSRSNLLISIAILGSFLTAGIFMVSDLLLKQIQ